MGQSMGCHTGCSKSFQFLQKNIHDVEWDLILVRYTFSFSTVVPSKNVASIIQDRLQSKREVNTGNTYNTRMTMGVNNHPIPEGRRQRGINFPEVGPSKKELLIREGGCTRGRDDSQKEDVPEAWTTVTNMLL